MKRTALDSQPATQAKPGEENIRHGGGNGATTVKQGENSDFGWQFGRWQFRRRKRYLHRKTWVKTMILDPVNSWGATVWETIPAPLNRAKTQILAGRNQVGR